MTTEALSRSIFQGLEVNDGLDYWQNFPPILASHNFESTNDEIEAIVTALIGFNDDKIGQGRENAKRYLKENESTCKEIENAVKEFIGLDSDA